MDTFQMECLKDGTWSHRIPTCKSKKTKLVGYTDRELPSMAGFEQRPHKGDSVAGALYKKRGRNSADP